jgi:hypothetical protein
MPVVEGGMIARTYAELRDAIALRLVELNVPQLELDERCGLAQGASGRILGPKPTKNYGPLSFDLHMEALGPRLVVEPDPDRKPAIANTRELPPRVAEAVLEARLRTREGLELLRQALRECGRKGARKRRQMAREAAEAREADCHVLHNGHGPTNGAAAA